MLRQITSGYGSLDGGRLPIRPIASALIIWHHCITSTTVTIIVPTTVITTTTPGCFGLAAVLVLKLLLCWNVPSTNTHTCLVHFGVVYCNLQSDVRLE
jgi:hypothetical protein